VLAIFDYFTKEASLLSFPGGVVIKILRKEGIDKGESQSYVFSIDINYYNYNPGWMYGEYEGNHGSFPSEYVHPIVGLRATESAIEVCT